MEHERLAVLHEGIRAVGAHEAHERGIDGQVRREDKHLLPVAEAAVEKGERSVEVRAGIRDAHGERAECRVERLASRLEGIGGATRPSAALGAPLCHSGADALEELTLLGGNTLHLYACGAVGERVRQCLARLCCQRLGGSRTVKAARSAASVASVS